MDKQKFQRGDVVHIAKYLGESMSHFTNNKDVVILGSYADKFGGRDTKSYTVLFIENGNETSWYQENQLTFIRHENEEYIQKILTDREEYNKKVGQLGWIVANWKDIRNSTPHSAVVKLMYLVGITEPWGKHGEYWDFIQHWRVVFRLLDDILLTGDIEKVKDFIEKLEKVDSFLLSNDLYNGNSIRKEIPDSWRNQ